MTNIFRASFCLLIFWINIAKIFAQQSAVTNEMVMSSGMSITVSNKVGTITITAGQGFKRSYTWDGATRSVDLWPRKERWYGSLGAYYPGPGEHWKNNHGITRGVLEEGQQHFQTMDEAMHWIELPYHNGCVYRNNGLMVWWKRVLERKQLNVEVWQIYIGGKKPQKLSGSHDSLIIVSSSSKS
jgi:hypothetical protein